MFPRSLWSLMIGVAVVAVSFAGDSPLVRTEMHAGRPEVHVLSWDTEGGRRAETNLLRSGKPVDLRVRVDGRWKQGTEFPTSPEPAPPKSTTYRLRRLSRRQLSFPSGGLAT